MDDENVYKAHTDIVLILNLNILKARKKLTIELLSFPTNWYPK